MFKRRTLFIVGAGASAEFDLPVGTKLAGIIANKLDIRVDHGRIVEKGGGDIDIWEHLMREHQGEPDEYLAACWLIRDGVQLSNSIDDFLDVHSQNTAVRRVGKVAIAKAILEAERESKLFLIVRASTTK